MTNAREQETGPCPTSTTTWTQRKRPGATAESGFYDLYNQEDQEVSRESPAQGIEEVETLTSQPRKPDFRTSPLDEKEAIVQISKLGLILGVQNGPEQNSQLLSGRKQ